MIWPRPTTTAEIVVVSNGEEIPWDISNAVERIFVNPYAPDWMYGVVEATLRKFNPAMAERLSQSQMRGTPYF